MTTIITSDEGIHYVIRGGKLIEACLHRTKRDESEGKMRKEVCADCSKVLLFNPDVTRKSASEEFRETFRAMHGREPRGEELSQMF